MKPTPKQILEIQGTDSRYLTRDQVRWFTPEQVSGFTRDQVRGFTRDQVRGFTRDQVSWFTPDQVSWFTPYQVSGFTRDQVSWFTRDQVSWMEFVKNPPVLKKPYTKILEAVTSHGKLEMGTWHTCNTTHCIGGWTVVLTKGGCELEARFNTATAARIILSASRPDAPLPNFTASNEAALAFIEARAAEEAE